MSDNSLKVQLNAARYAVLALGLVVCLVVLVKDGFGQASFMRLAEVLGPALLATYVLLTFYQELERRVFATLIFKTVLGDHVTSEAIELFRREIGDNALVRPDSKWVFSFKENGAFMELDLKIESHLRNVSPKAREHLSPRLGGSKEDSVNLTSYMFGPSDADSLKVFDFDADPPPESFPVAPYRMYTEELNAAGKYAVESVFDQHHTRTFIGTLEIEFSYPRGFDVDLAQHFSSKPRGGEIVRLYKKASKEWDRERRNWRIDTVLPQQGVSFRVTRKVTKSNAP